jgi:hypothetical protein
VHFTLFKNAFVEAQKNRAPELCYGVGMEIARGFAFLFLV